MSHEPSRRRLLRVGRFAGLAGGLVFVAACAASRPAQYVVRPGDSLFSISRALDTSVGELVRENGIRDPDRIRVGQVLRVPGRAASSSTMDSAVADSGATTTAVSTLLWPVTGGLLSSAFGERGAGFHDGIDIAAPTGSPVQASERGVVEYSGFRRGYGNVVVVRHAPGLSTVYAHNQSNWVRAGQRVRRGEVIATVGETGRTTGPNLHFEIWVGKRLVDPMRYFSAPPRVESAAATY